MRTRRRPFSFDPKRRQFVRRPVLFHLQQNFAASELRFRKIDKEPETSLDWIPFRRQIGAVERITHFQAQRVARAKSAWLDPELISFIENAVPKFRRVLCTKENFHAIFACITSPRDRNRHIVQLEIDNVISRWKIDIVAEQCLEKLDNARALNGNAAEIRSAIL